MSEDENSSDDDSYIQDLNINESEDEPELDPELSVVEPFIGEIQVPVSQEEGVEGAQPLAQPIGKEPLGVESIKDLPANFSFETYDLKMFEGEYVDIYSPQVLEQRYNSQENEDEQKISLIKLNSATNKVFVGLNLYGKDLTGFNFDNKTFISCVFAYANLSKVSMRNAVLYDCNFQNITGNEINLSDSLLYECNFFKADFINAVMKNLYCKYPTSLPL